MSPKFQDFGRDVLDYFLWFFISKKISKNACVTVRFRFTFAKPNGYINFQINLS